MTTNLSRVLMRTVAHESWFEHSWSSNSSNSFLSLNAINCNSDWYHYKDHLPINCKPPRPSLWTLFSSKQKVELWCQHATASPVSPTHAPLQALPTNHCKLHLCTTTSPAHAPTSPIHAPPPCNLLDLPACRCHLEEYPSELAQLASCLWNVLKVVFELSVADVHVFPTIPDIDPSSSSTAIGITIHQNITNIKSYLKMTIYNLKIFIQGQWWRKLGRKQQTLRLKIFFQCF